MKRFTLMFSVLLVVVFTIPLASYALCVNVPYMANLRSGPGKKYRIIWQVYKYMPLQELSSSGNWYRVRDIDGDIEYIEKPLVTSGYSCAAVRSKTAILRTGPGINYPDKYRGDARKYDSFRVIREEGPWVEVRSDFNQTGWINKKSLWIR